MTPEQLKLKRERERRYRERNAARWAALGAQLEPFSGRPCRASVGARCPQHRHMQDIHYLTKYRPRREVSAGDRMSRADRETVGVWAAAHVVLLILLWVSRGRFQQWDASLLQNIAAHGYFSAASTPHNVAFFPGYSIVLAGVHFVLRTWTASELLVAGVSSLVAMLGLTRLVGPRASLMLATMPAAVFLFVGYQESLFLALAVWAWVHARRGNWCTAALLAAASGLVRPEGALLTVALVVMALLEPRRRLVKAAIALYGLIGPLAYEVYLWVMTGTRDAWGNAEQAGWDMHRVTPWSGWLMTWHAAFDQNWLAGQYRTLFQIQLLAVVLLALATVAALALRQWPEFTFCVLALASAVSITWYESTARDLLLVFPVVVLLARAPRWLQASWLVACTPIAMFVGYSYLSGAWAGLCRDHETGAWRLTAPGGAAVEETRQRIC